MAIRDWPAAERPRERLLERGADALTAAELLAIFLRTGVAGRTAVDLARSLLDDVGGLAPLLGADRARFCAAPGLGDAKFAQLKAVLELNRRYLAANLRRGDALSCPADTFAYLRARLATFPYEVFACLFRTERGLL